MNEEQVNAQDVEEAQNKNVSVSDFLKGNVETVENKEIKFPRFKSAFVIKPLSAKDLTDIRKKATSLSFNKKIGQSVKTVDQDKLSDEMVIASVVTPDLNNAELQSSYGTVADPVGTIQAMLEAGEYTELMEEIQELSGFESAEDSVEEVKK